MCVCVCVCVCVRIFEFLPSLTDEWARPIFGLASDFKSFGRDEREERDYANLTKDAQRRLR